MNAERSKVPSAQGNLANTPFAHVLLYLEHHRLSGTLELTAVRGETSRRDAILFELGSPAVFHSSQGQGLGHFLPWFADASANYAFYQGYDGVSSHSDSVRVRLDVHAWMAGALRTHVREDVLQNTLARWGQAPLHMRGGIDLQRFDFQKDELAFVELLRAEPATLQAWIGRSGFPAPLAKRVLYLLTICKAVEPLEASAPASAPTIASQVPRVATQAPASATHKPEPPVVIAAQKKHEPPEAPASLSMEVRERWNEVRKRALALDSQNYFDMLGVAKDMENSKIRDTYFELAKTWHPDRLPAELAPLRMFAEQIFHYLTEAYQTLTDEQKRGHYLRAVQEGGGTPASERKIMQIVQATVEYQKAEVLIRRRDFSTALEHVLAALAMNDEESDYYAMLGWIRYHLHSENTPSVIEEMLGPVEKALTLHEDHSRAHFYKAMILKRAEKTAESTKHLKRAVELDPKFIDAQRELRLLEMRKHNTSGPTQSPPRPSKAPAKPSKAPTKPPAKASFWDKLTKK